ncbi:formate dehydrogenase H, selenopolypeptide subunit [Klebsiella pneumoniae]|uniref:Formate dehydrogenase H, selenopolypeptide subunit n=1 Tax=Klebsiella pneumoniae TaxID=573 RepID=A0A378H1P8_KLEPN|nr:formate dehydrogenase H, selenopolypeptide subunit [Klebsiella pneumoniae]
MSNSISDIENSSACWSLATTAPTPHPIVARRVIKARDNGAKIIVCDPRRIETARIADRHLQLNNGSNMALVNAFGYVLLEEELYNKTYVERYTEGLDAYREAVKDYAPEAVEGIVGVSAREIREAMRMFAAAPSATIMWGMGVTQFGQAVDVVRGLASLALLTGNLGRPNVGVGPVRGQNNVQGACDMGVLPNLFPGYQEVTDPAVRAKFAAAWGIDPALMDDQVGTRITEVPHKALTGEIKAYYIMGEDPLQTEADLGLVRKGIEALDFVVVQDIFMTKTAEIGRCPAAGHLLGRARRRLHLRPTAGSSGLNRRSLRAGNVKRDWEIISLLASELGYPMHYEKQPADLGRDARALPAVLRRDLGENGRYGPCSSGRARPSIIPGTPWLYKDNRFDTPSGKGQLFATAWRAPAERPDDEWPLVLCTVREVGPLFLPLDDRQLRRAASRWPTSRDGCR